MVTDKLPISYICTINDEVIFNTGKLIGLITKKTHIHPGKNQDLPF